MAIASAANSSVDRGKIDFEGLVKKILLRDGDFCCGRKGNCIVT
jgi:hypothetical protein